MADPDMEAEEIQSTVPFQLQFDKPIPSQVKIAEWNPEKDLLAMVTEDSKILLHRFNWQRLWTVSPGRCITSLCWRPDGKAIAVGLEDGTISLHDVENGKLLRSIKSHKVAVVCLNWEEDGQPMEDESCNFLTYEDRTLRFFPPAPRIPRMPGLCSGDTGLMDDTEEPFHEVSNTSHQPFNILCSGDKDGCICFSIFGIFPIGKIDIHQFTVYTSYLDKQTGHQLLNGYTHKVALSKNLCQLIVLSFGKLVENVAELEDKSHRNHAELSAVRETSEHQNVSLVGLHCLLLDTSIFHKRKNELHQVAQQASNIEDLFEVVRASLSVMHKQWCDALHIFHEKFGPLSSLIIDHGLNTSPQEEFLSLLCGARTSPALHQFLVNSLGELGLKHVAKAVDSAGKELHLVVREHLQPAVEIIGFRIGELKGFSRWRARYQNVGLDEKLIENASERAGMLLVQVERFLRVLSIVCYQFENFFAWIRKCIKLLMAQPTDELANFNSELVVIFLKFLIKHDPVRQLLESSDVDDAIKVDLDTMQRIEELVTFGGFSDTGYLRRSLAKEFEQLECSFKEALLKPFTTISKMIQCEEFLPLYPIPSSTVASVHAPTSISFYQDAVPCKSEGPKPSYGLVDYICFRIPDDSLDVSNTIIIVRGFVYGSGLRNMENYSLEAAVLSIPEGFHCVDLSLYKETQIVLLLNEVMSTSESPGKSCMMMVQASELPFVSVSRSATSNMWKLNELQGSAVELDMNNGKIRSVPHALSAPLAVSASRGVACVFASRRRALVYILDEDEDEASDMD
ncbi:Anaphase-promoting complex subunit 4 [Acorus calamus]|uniref:Anaphase-promoting complex subunit 4 n=1 Tax=Acorus calamus TaxID=4465 RepID=A0AAV9CT76_ACOCL|nr:Anaphase-promoting complex subunit 4 [Acorus calamus]